MGEAERPGMQHRPLDGQVADRADLAPAVGLIAEDGMAERDQVDSDLMCAACPGMYLHKSCLIARSLRPEALHDLELRDRVARRGRPGRELLPVFGVASDGQLDAARLALHCPPDQRQVDPMDGMGLELLREAHTIHRVYLALVR